MTEKDGFLISYSGKCGPVQATEPKNRSIRSIVTVLSAYFLIVATAGVSSPLSQVSDPLFGLKYDPHAVMFEPAPTELYSACKELTNERWDRRIWIFARTDKPGVHYAVIGGYYVKREIGDGTALTIEPDSVGAVVRLDGHRCELIGPAREVFDYPPNDIALSQLQELANDAVCRYSHAFGSRPRLMDAMRRQRIQLNARSSILREAVSTPNVCR